MTGGGGNNFAGTIFKITPQGSLTTLHEFNNTDGSSPVGGLIQGTDGNLYGTTSAGGDNSNCDCGTIFKISLRGELTTLHNFVGSDGYLPQGTLLRALDGNFYGTTTYGGSTANGGTVFRITRSGALTTLDDFCALPTCADGASPIGGLMQATDDNLYGTTFVGGAENLGTVFEINSGGALVTLHSFGSSDGSYPHGVLAQHTNGTLYGTTYQGSGGFDYCGGGCGSIFSLDMGLGPFVTFVRAAGKVGQTGPILGQGFTGTTSVMLNGVSANFTVVSDTYIRATVPAGATTGYVTVTTPGGTLTSSVPFRVIP